MKQLEKISKDKDNSLTFEEFLEHVNMNEEEYIKMIRSEFKKAKVFLKRAPTGIRINVHNPMIMSLHKANMDIQFILDPYAYLAYCVSYINKSENGMSKLLREALNELKRGNNTDKERLRVLANKFLNSSEISAQEAVYHILSIPLSINSRSTIFINTNRPENRISIVKSDEILQKLDPDSKDIFVQGLIDMYVNRSDEMKNVCFADFTSLYNVTKRIAYNDGIAENSDDEEVIDNEIDEFNPLKMKNIKENILSNVMNLIKNGDEQFFHFINGGAGVGSNPESIHVALCAQTGKAAASIDGMTLHSFLSLPVNRCKHKLVKLNSDVSNRIGVKLKHLQLLIIDEISMVGFTMFQQVNARLQQIMKVKKPFGGISLIVLGDFNQLRLVGDKYIF
ncbi:unnamed protein product [Rotaria magnacalcarata]|uniref:ATP-dependent DNA helicase n=1 Tax=Rotaria magnacalcarata TaxID=392030 RepID=A0A816LIC0_9BILA|nr:unnamed protein product [Rotaria magnacalcarata]CAF1941159.1 unnamed protein product [Rotaria magnacalcarata]CAF2128066.1 unnamed protein product [Rotaria magnacalcarata]